MIETVNFVTKLIQLLSETLFEEEGKEVVIFGSAAIYLHGVELNRDIDDLDVFASNLTFKKISKRYEVQCKPAKEGGKVPFIAPHDDIEILKSFPGVDFNNVFKNAVQLESSGEFRVGSLDDLKAWKSEQERDKDLDDIAAIDRHVNQKK